VVRDTSVYQHRRVPLKCSVRVTSVLKTIQVLCRKCNGISDCKIAGHRTLGIYTHANSDAKMADQGVMLDALSPGIPEGIMQLNKSMKVLWNAGPALNTCLRMTPCQCQQNRG
jgi:hypothetical protein